MVGNGVVILTAELFKGLAGGFGDEDGGEAAEQHEESIDLKDVVHPRSSDLGGGSLSAQSSDGTLADDGSDLAGGSGDTVGGGTVTGGEHLTGDDKGGSVGACVACSLAFVREKNRTRKLLTKVEEELGDNVDSKEAVGAQLVVGETHNNEEDGQDSEATKLDGLTAQSINGSNGNPVSRDGTSEDNDNVTNSGVVQVLVDGGGVLGRVANDVQDGTVVEGETIKGDIEAEP